MVARRSQDQVSDLPRMRHQGQMTRCEFDRRGIHSLGQKSLELRIDCAILRRYLIKGRLDPPGGLRGPCGDERVGTSPLDGVERARPSGRQVTGEVFEKALLAQPKISVRLYYSCTRGRPWKLRCERPEVFTCVGRASRHVDQSRDDWVVARFTDNRPCE